MNHQSIFYIADSLYELKGAARPAAEFYAPKVEPVEKRDLLEEYKHNLWDIQEGKDYLTAQFEYATALHNLMNKSRDAITIFEEMIDLDKEDHMVIISLTTFPQSFYSLLIYSV